MPTTKARRHRQLSALPRRARDPGAPPPRAARKPARARKVDAGGAAAGDPRCGARRCSPSTASRRRGSTTWRRGPASPRARSISTSSDKEALFEELVRGAVSPIIEAREQGGERARRAAGASARDLLRPVREGGAGHQAQAAAAADHRRGPALSRRSPSSTIARSSRAASADARALPSAARSQGEFASDAPARFPQLIVAPLLLAVVWDGLFSQDRSPRRRRTAARASRGARAARPGRGAP